MKARVYVRIARTQRARDGWKVDASMNPTPRPLVMGNNAFGQEDLHTLAFALNLDIPDELLKPATWPTIEVSLPLEAAQRVPIEVEVEPQEVPAT